MIWIGFPVLLLTLIGLHEAAKLCARGIGALGRALLPGSAQETPQLATD